MPDESAVIVKTDHNPYCAKVTLSESAFFDFKFQAIKWIKTKEDPQDRHWAFESTNEFGVWDFDVELSLIESRKTRDEKSREKNEHYAMLELFKRNGIKYAE